MGNVAHTGALTLALVHDASNLMTSLRLLVALLGAWDARCDRPWQRMEDKDVQTLQYTPPPSPSLEVVHTLSLHALLSLSSPFHSVLCILLLALLRSSA